MERNSFPYESITLESGHPPVSDSDECMPAIDLADIRSKTPTPSDAELVARYLDKSSQDAFASLVLRYQKMVIGTAYRRTGNVELARDIGQEVFVTLIRKMPGLIGRNSLGGWLYQATVYESARALQGEKRRDARHARYAADLPTASMPSEVRQMACEQTLILDDALSALSEADREVLILHYFQDLTYAEISLQLGLTEAAVRQRVCRALNRLSKHLRVKGGGGAALALLLAASGIHASVAAPCGLATAAFAAAAATGGSSGAWVLGGLLTHLGVKTATSLVIGSIGLASVWLVLSNEDQFEPRLPETVQVGAFIQGQNPSSGSTALVTNNRGASTSIAQTNSGAMAQEATTAARRATVQGNLSLPIRSLPRLQTAQQTTQATNSKKPTSSTAKTSSSDPVSNKSSVPSGAPRAPEQIQSRLKELATIGGVPAVIEELRNVELVPEEAAQVYSDVIAKALSLEPVKQLQVEEILQKHYQQLKTEGLAGVKPLEITKDAWDFARKEVIESTVDTIVQTLPVEVKVVPKLVDTVLSLPEKLEEPVAAVVSQDVITEVIQTKDDVVSAVVNVVTPALPVSLPLLR